MLALLVEDRSLPLALKVEAGCQPFCVNAR
jgi:hypothetical protein